MVNRQFSIIAGIPRPVGYATLFQSVSRSRDADISWSALTFQAGNPAILMVKSLSSANVGDNFGSFHELTTTAHFEGRGVAFAPWYMLVPIKISVNN